MPGKMRYELDLKNRLILEKSEDGKALPEFRKVAEGRFKVSPDNELEYMVESGFASKNKIPSRIRLKGAWELTGEHDIKFNFDKSHAQSGAESITLKGEVVDVRKNSLLFALTTSGGTGRLRTYAIELRGVWKNDAFNRLTFTVKRNSGIHNVFTFSAAWDIDEKNRLVYRYEKTHLVRKTKKVHELVFSGSWDIKNASRITYSLGAGSDSELSFRMSCCFLDKNSIKYEIGIGAHRSAVYANRTFTLFGKWKIRKGLGLVFEYKCGDKTSVISFSAEAEMKNGDILSFNIRTENVKRSSGLTLEIDYSFLKGDAVAFVRYLRSKEEKCVLLGAGLRW